MDCQNTENVNQQILRHSLGKGSSPSHSALDIPTIICTGICYTAHMDHPNQSYLLNHCGSQVIILAFQVYVHVHCILHARNGKIISSSILGTSVMASFLLPVSTNHNPMSSIWVYHAFGDPLLMCAIFLHSAVHLDAVYQRPPSRLTLHYGMEAARLMNLRLDSGDLSLQDTSIAAVIMMLANQVCLVLQVQQG
jgi:hypothetical protein